MWITIIILIVLVLIGFSLGDKSKDKKKRLSESNARNYPNLKQALTAMYGQGAASLYADNGRVVTYEMDVLFGNRKVGKTYFILGLSRAANTLVLSYKGNDGIEVLSNKQPLSSMGDVSKEEYFEAINNCSIEIAGDPRWIRSTSGVII